ncbi:MAG: DUF3332 family protein [Bdellovibrio sp.]
MNSKGMKLGFYVGAFLSCLTISMTTGCASGGFKLTREYARWVNSKNIILRIVLYILTFAVFAITMLIDAVIFNTMDFWEGKVSQGTYDFTEGQRSYHVKHEFQSGTPLKYSTIEVRDENQSLLQTVVLKEMVSGDIELYVDGKLRSRVRDVTSLPVASFFDEKGSLVQEDVGLLMPSVALYK